MRYPSAGQLLCGGIAAMAALAMTGGVAHADNEQGVVRSTEIGVVNGGSSTTRYAEIGDVRGGGMSTVRSADTGEVLGGTDAVSGNKFTPEPLAKPVWQLQPIGDGSTDGGSIDRATSAGPGY